MTRASAGADKEAADDDDDAIEGILSPCNETVIGLRACSNGWSAIEVVAVVIRVPWDENSAIGSRHIAILPSVAPDSSSRVVASKAISSIDRMHLQLHARRKIRMI